jgi:hypothetical protein
MANQHRDLRSSYQRLATRPVPITWLRSEPYLAAYRTPAEIVAAIRDEDTCERSDATLRAIRRLARTDRDAATVALEALTIYLSFQLPARATEVFRNDALSDMAMVLLEDNDDHGRRLARRLARRAQARTSRRARLEQRCAEPLHVVDDVLDDADVAEVATNRAHLHEMHQRIQAAIKDGSLARAAWDDFRDARLAPVIGGREGDVSRTRSFRGRRAVHAILDHAC